MNPRLLPEEARRELRTAMRCGRLALALHHQGHRREMVHREVVRARAHLSAARAWRTGDPRLPMVGGAR